MRLKVASWIVKLLLGDRFSVGYNPMAYTVEANESRPMSPVELEHIDRLGKAVYGTSPIIDGGGPSDDKVVIDPAANWRETRKQLVKDEERDTD